MTTTSHRTRLALLALLLLSLEFLLFTRPAHGGWSTEPVQVHATTALCPLVSASDDAHYGAIVAWHENTASGGLLKARHLLATGDVDPSWSAPTLLSTAEVSRAALGSVADGVGGAYVWWMESLMLYVTRVAPDGAIAPGWPARGRLLGTLPEAGSRPVACADGSGGVYLAWLTTTGSPTSWYMIRAHRLGPDNTAKGGWPSGGRTLAGTMALEEHASTFGIAAAPDGGLWLAYGSTVEIPDGTFTFQPGEVRVLRLAGGGLPATGWAEPGVPLATFRGDLLAYSENWGLAPRMRLTAVANDASGGAFVLFPEIQGDGMVWAGYRLLRVDPTGGIATGWPPEGVSAQPIAGLPIYDGGSADLSLRLHEDRSGGVFAGRPEAYDHGSDYRFDRYSASGALVGDSFTSGIHGLETVARSDGGAAAASFWPTGPYGYFDPLANLHVSQSNPGASFNEWHPEPLVQWYGDIGLAGTGDGGTIFAWSQVNERFGVFAIRLNPSGIVTGVPPGSAVQRLRLWFARGSGVQVEAPAGLVSLALHDVTGRVAARGTSDASGRWTLPGTVGLPSGVYFAHAKWSDRETHARVVVIR